MKLFALLILMTAALVGCSKDNTMQCKCTPGGKCECGPDCNCSETGKCECGEKGKKP